MPRAAPMLTTFNGGEWSPDLYGRVDLAKYQSAMRTCLNFIPRVTGVLSRRSGTRFIAETKGSVAAWLVPFEFSTTQAYVLEFSNNLIRVYKDGGIIESSPGTPLEIVTTYTAAQIPALKWCQSADVLYLTHPSHPPRKLTRSSHTAWTLTDLTTVEGPYRDTNTDTAVYLKPSANTGAITLTVTGGELVTNGTFETAITGWTDASGAGSSIAWNVAKHMDLVSGGADYAVARQTLTTAAPTRLHTITFTVGTGALLMRVGTTAGAEDIKLEASYAVGTHSVTFTPGAGHTSLFVQFRHTTAATHTLDTVTCRADGSYFVAGHVGACFRIQHGTTWGAARVTAYTSAVSVNATVITGMNFSDVAPSNVWREGAWSTYRGFPACATFHEQRFFLAGSTAQPQTLWGSVTGDYENFAPSAADGTVTDDSAVTYTLSDAQVNAIRWLASGQVLIPGTTGGPFSIKASSLNEALTPSNVTAKKESTEGCANIPPVRVGSSVFYVQDFGKAVNSIGYSWEADSWLVSAVTMFVRHLARNGVTGMAWHNEPWSVLWCVASGGKLYGLTYSKEHQVAAWHQHIIGGEGLVKSIAVIPGATEHELWMVVERTIGGATKRYVERMEPEFYSNPAAETSVGAFFVDSGLTYSGTAATTISGLTHLEGETVSVLADGATHPDRTVMSGAITLDRAASEVVVGYPFTSAMQTMDLEAGAADGAAQGKTRRIHEAVVRFFQSMGGYVGYDATHLELVPMRRSTDAMGAAPALYTGDVRVLFPKGWDRAAKVQVNQTLPLPMTVTAIMPRLTAND